MTEIPFPILDTVILPNAWEIIPIHTNIPPHCLTSDDNDHKLTVESPNSDKE
ncbi:hypothetical protein ANACOL_03891 [Anaerotruncus colihominis DSM 17241]|jgi:hypothetical protein|uniref:Uncharacterized protein n=1 Tax=Anaerotruncus colihominis DSM 17241 TaxID=445972 RepID=B0PGF7_9FIRM|nr:hypothetical protein ANACOL_03891 [Anaerotruncus colihominis DSM 17241]